MGIEHEVKRRSTASTGADRKGIVGWDIGAANVKAAWLSLEKDRTEQVRTTSHPFEIWREKERLSEILQRALADCAPGVLPRAMAVTMTAELSDVFATKREGVLYLFDSIRNCFPGTPCYALNGSGSFSPLHEAAGRPLEYAATNWLASALWIARKFPDCLMLDVGSTTTDIIPILDGRVAAGGCTDMQRLAAGELVYTGVLRTNLAAIVHTVPVAGRVCRVASEYFSNSGDVHLLLGHLRVRDYTCSTPDGLPPSVASARRRLARLVCADTEMLTPAEIDEMAAYIHEQQVRQIIEGIKQVVARLPLLLSHPVIILGAGAFLGKTAALRLGLAILDSEGEWNRGELEVAPCAAAARLLAERMKTGAL